MWLDLVITSGIIKSDLVNEMLAESFELLKILASMRKNLSK
ncbi:MAG: hypothetical protein HQ522_05580 [Bacteroidetes bacterium]|nr:hypothetical protein [Bacteroidota bacterium]